MFVTTLTLIYSALAVFVLAKYIQKKTKNIEKWASDKGFNHTAVYRLIYGRNSSGDQKSDISKIYVK